MPRPASSSSSTTPLLIRSSPALGTGSYGALPDLSSSPESPPKSPTASKRKKGKTRSRLRNLFTSSDNPSSNGVVTEDEHSAAAGAAETAEDRSHTTPATIDMRRRSSTDEQDPGVKLAKVRPVTSSAGYSAFHGETAGSSSTAVFPFPESDSSSTATDYDAGQVHPLQDSDADIDTDDDDEGLAFNPHANSPYAQVRASVPNTDDTSLSISTPRMWTLAILFSVVGSSTNLFFSLRYPSVSITPFIALLLAHPLGRIWDLCFPEIVSATTIYGKLMRWLGQGRWNKKEHACVYISSNVSFGFAFATDVIVSQNHFYKQPTPILYQILLTLSTQFLGYTFAGLTRQWLVYPSSMIWPVTLQSTAMFTTLHDRSEGEEEVKGWEKWGRWKFFMTVLGGSVAWYFFPGFIWPGLSYFNIGTWAKPDSVVLANLFGTSTGLGLIPITFDWAQMSYIGSPIITPLWAATNVLIGLIAVMWILAPILYYSNVFFSSYMPILSSSVYDNTGGFYDVQKVLTQDFMFDEAGYKSYSKVFLPITYVLSYALQFAAMTALVTHTTIWHGKDIWKQGKRALKIGSITKTETTGTYQRLKTSSGKRIESEDDLNDEEWADIVGDEDVHVRLMKKYPEAPTSWYLATGVVTTLVGMWLVEAYEIHLPWYGLLLALFMCTIFFVPVGIVMAITNQQSSIFLICQMVAGYVFAGRGIANMVFVTYGYITSTQGLKFASDLKLGQYVKIPPRMLFTVQMVATAVGSLTQIGVLNWMFGSIPGICTPEALSGFTCPLARVHFNGSVLWGVVGPSRFFGPGELYNPLVWAFAIGLIAPVIVWAYGRYTGVNVKRVSLPVVFGSLSWIPPATGLNFSTWCLVCYAVNGWIKKHRGDWWRKYRMVLSAALDTGLAVGVGVVFFAIVWPQWDWVKNWSWWGTEIYKQGCDWKGCALMNVAPGEIFGPDRW
ncbi:hypothetical protein TWF102_004089 [Orbilia oligospora]|uniref:Uncharacterized protein n=3 Tax=Orbilia oligospora TaxID=2813651 RepID=A0A7C8JU74_ORBOL|nr:hypothetical protein TWF706_006642 [Orbilia oligospora]KAF3100292.1 hypothetical protein TWF103_008309 [Orbilia oligospora]KAF3112689.1 hypothetical protein TWF102_004089 [Orbilia oligospora]KAF3123250.1 hypothetical protein TWF594_002471 [Orbilia oligospora]KAF3142864.1 hypothetical protein TWF703_000368 [Orbilia oligospora]